MYSFTLQPPGKHLETTGADDLTLWLSPSLGSSAPVVSRCFPGGYNVKLYISRGRLAWWLLAFLCCAVCWAFPKVKSDSEGMKLQSIVIIWTFDFVASFWPNNCLTCRISPFKHLSGSQVSAWSQISTGSKEDIMIMSAPKHKSQMRARFKWALGHRNFAGVLFQGNTVSSLAAQWLPQEP